jgi:phosphate transport system permease protein
LSNLFAAGLGVAILTIPLVASVSEDAMSSVPDALREASSGLGARKMTTSLRVVMPAAVSGLVAALILATSRAIGETMVVLIAGGADQAVFTASPFQPSLTMTAAMASLAGGSDAVVGQGNAYQSLFFVGLLLFAITLGLNVVANRIVRRVRQKY